MAWSHRVRLLYSPEEPAVEIVAVQGLWAHPQYTWMKDGVSWLSEFLPKDVPKARVRAFGLETPVTSGSIHLRKYLRLLCLVRATTATEIDAQAHSLLEAVSENRNPSLPLILIGHSFGGLVVKQAMVIACKEPQFKDLYNAVAGLLFIGTPHRGSKLASRAKSWLFPAYSDIRAVLAVGSSDLTRLDKEFAEVPWVNDANNADRIHCFYELLPTKYGINSFILLQVMTVDRVSATLKGHPSHGLAATHSYLVKFSDYEDPNYQAIAQVIAQMSARSRQAMAADLPMNGQSLPMVSS